jgi:hypothetical protein
MPQRNAALFRGITQRTIFTAQQIFLSQGEFKIRCVVDRKVINTKVPDSVSSQTINALPTMPIHGVRWVGPTRAKSRRIMEASGWA